MKIKSKTIIKFLILLNIIFVNSVIAGIFSEKSTKIKDTLKKGEGIAIVQFVNNSRTQRGLSNWDYVVLENIKTKKTYKMLPIHNNGFLASIIFAGVLKVGIYRLVAIKETSEYALATISTQMNTNPITSNLGEFRITEKYITDLGTVILNPIYVELKNGDIARRLISINTNEENHLAPILKQTNPETYNSADLSSILGWEKQNLEQNKAILQKIKQHGIPFKYQFINDSNMLVIYHKLGGISFVEEGKLPVDIHTGYFSNFMSYLKTPSGHLLAGENGLILFSSELNGPWKRLDVLDVKHNVLDMYYENKTIIAITSYNEYPCPEDITCKGTNKLSINLKNKSFFLISTNENNLNYPAVEDSYFLIPGEKFVFGQTKGYKLKNGIIVSYKRGFMNPVNFHKPKISFDNGKSWKTIKSNIEPYYFINGYNTDRPIYVNKDKMVYVVASPQHKRYKKKSKHKSKESESKEKVINLYKMPINNIDTKSKEYIISKIDPFCSRIIPNISSDDTLYLSCINGDLIKSTDDAKTWQLVYENK